MKKYSDMEMPKEAMDEEFDMELDEEYGSDDSKPDLGSILADFSKEEIEEYLASMDSEDLDMDDESDESDEDFEFGEGKPSVPGGSN